MECDVKSSQVKSSQVCSHADGSVGVTVPSAAPSRPALIWPLFVRVPFWGSVSRHSGSLAGLLGADRPAGMTSHATSIPTRVFYEQQDTSLIRYPAQTHPSFGRRLHRFAATNPVMPYGPYAGESIFDPIPLHPAPPNLPMTGNGCVDILAIIQPHVSTKQLTPAGRLAHRISNSATNMVQGDGFSYEKDTADGAGRAYPLPPNAGPQWHGPPQMVQPANGVLAGQVLTCPSNPRTHTPCLQSDSPIQ